MLYLIKWMYAWILPLGGIVLAFMILTAYLFRKKQGGRWAMLIITALFYLVVHRARFGQPHPSFRNGL